MQDRIIKLLKIAVVVTLNLCIIGLAAASSGGETVSALSKRGSRGSEVRQIQTRLKKWGYYKGNVDGIYGAQTEKAVRYFQSKNGLRVDGIAGPATLRAIGLPTGGGGGGSSGGYSSTDVNLLARIISAEARGESYTGQVAVGAVVLNRVRHPSFPDTIAGVIYQPGAFTAITDGQIHASVTETSKKAARDAINGWDPSGGAIYYYNPDKTSNQWIRSRPVIKRIGKHLFCK